MYMKKEKAISIIQEVFPKIYKHFGDSKYFNYELNVYVHSSHYERHKGEYDFDGNITIYSSQISSKRQLIKTLLHEYCHYLQPKNWYYRYYTLGYDYDNHPYEIEALEFESHYKNFI